MDYRAASHKSPLSPVEADWVRPYLSIGASAGLDDLAIIVPSEYRYSARIFHQIIERSTKKFVTWRSLCERYGVEFEPRMLWYSLYGKELDWHSIYDGPYEGRLRAGELREIGEAVDEQGKVNCVSYVFPEWFSFTTTFAELVSEIDVGKAGPQLVWPPAREWLLCTPYDGHSSYLVGAKGRLKSWTSAMSLENVYL